MLESSGTFENLKKNLEYSGTFLSIFKHVVVSVVEVVESILELLGIFWFIL
jgi:hypothetical protein